VSCQEPGQGAVEEGHKLERSASVRVTVLEGSKVVKRFLARTGTSGRLTLPAKGLARGDYRVKLVAEDVTATLTSRRL
jgi:hypothetical protein